MRPVLTAIAAVLLWNVVALAGFDISDMLFRPNMNADKELMQHASTNQRQPVYQTQDTSTQVEIDLCDPENFKELFKELTYAPERYTRYKGLDHTALFASSVTLSDKYAVIGSNGYDVFKGIVHVYVPKTVSKWSLQALIRSPVWDNGNFGNDVSVDDERMVVAANAYNKYDGIVFVYERNLIHACWLLTATIESPLASGPNRTLNQGFGYRVDMSGNFLIAATSVNNAYIFKEIAPGNWTLHTDLQPPAKEIFFGRAVAIDGHLAVVGAYGYDRNVGRVFVYRYSPGNDSWDLTDQLVPLRTESNFGYSVDLHNSSLIVGANGFYQGQFENNQQFDARLTQPSVNYGWAYVYQLAANGSTFLLEQEIASPVGNNSYFGSGVGIYGDSIIVGADGYPCFGLTGAGFVFNKGPNGWTLNQSYPSPAGTEGHFGYAVDINANYSAIGAYGFDDLRGSIYLADRTPNDYVPPDVPVPAPTFAPSGGSEILSGGSLNKKVNDTGLTLGMILALALGVLVVAGAGGLVIYCCCCMIPIIPVLKKKKKKEEEEDSPYTVHSYAGYVEDEFYIPPAPPVVVIEEDEAIKKDLKKEKSVKFMENGELRKMFPYKVYGPRGYVEEENDTIPEELLVQKKEEDEALHGKGQAQSETRYEEYEEEYAGPMKGLPPPPQRVATRQESFQSGASSRHDYEYDKHQSRQYQQHSTSLVQQARQSYESSYSMDSHLYPASTSGPGSEDGSSGAYHSMSSLTAHSHHPPRAYDPYGAEYPLPQEQHDLGSHRNSASTMSSRRSSFAPYEDLHDDETVMSGSTEISSKSTGSLVLAAKERYRKFSQEQIAHTTSSTFQQHITTTTTTTNTATAGTLVSAIKQGYQASLTASSRDGDSVVSDHSGSSASASSFVAAAKEKYARLQSGSQQGSSKGASTAPSSDVGSSSLVDRLKARGVALSETTSMVSGTESGNPSHVAAARSRYANLQRTHGIASASADDGHDHDDGVSVATRSTVHSAGSSGSAVDAIKARYAKMRAETTAASSGESSLVDQVKAKYRASQRTAEGQDDDDSTVATHSTHSTTASSASQVERARAKYALLRERQQASMASDAASTRSGSTSSSLVEAARARGETYKRQSSDAAESDAQSQSMQSESQQSYSESGDQSSAYMVSAIKSRYQASSRMTATTATSSSTATASHSTSSYSHAAGSDESAVGPASEGQSSQRNGIAVQEDERSLQSQHSAPSSNSSVDSARSAAMNKFAFYKAKAEAEAAKARAQAMDQDYASSSGASAVAVRLKERVVPLRRGDSEWTMDDASEAVTALSVGDEHSSSAGADPSLSSSREDAKARAMAKAREKYARAKELAEQDRAAALSGAGAGTGAVMTAEAVERSRVVEEATRRLRESQQQSVSDAVREQYPPPPAASTVTRSSKTSSTSRTLTESAAHSLNVDSATEVIREATRTSSSSAAPRTSQP